MNPLPVPAASFFVEASFVILPILVFAGVWLLHRAAFSRTGQGPSPGAVGAVLLLWLGGTAGVALSGILGRFDLRPPPFGLLIVATIAASCVFGFSRIGGALATLPLAWLVGLQAFRLPLELVMHRAALEGVMPAQMSYSGRNFDIVTGATAALLAASMCFAAVPRWLVAAWNGLGAVLLANVVIVAMLSTPIVHAFGSEPGQLNTFVAFFPFVWLPAALVSTALAFHIIVARALRRSGALPA
jgi:hypothetical protein